jgi:hypothetical protein
MTRLAEYRLYRKFFSGHSEPEQPKCSHQTGDGQDESKDQAPCSTCASEAKLVKITYHDLRRPCAPTALAQLLTTIGTQPNPRLHALNLDGCGLAEDNGKQRVLRALFAASWITSIRYRRPAGLIGV